MRCKFYIYFDHSSTIAKRKIDLFLYMKLFNVIFKTAKMPEEWRKE